MYLAKALKYQQKHEDQTYKSKEHHFQEEHNYSRTANPCAIDVPNADDIEWVTACEDTCLFIEKVIPKHLEKRNLKINVEKTEELNIKNKGGLEWKNCKYLGTLFDAEEDLNRRKTLATSCFNSKKNILSSNKINLKTRIRIFNAYVTSIFMCNNEFWTVTKTLEKK